MLLCSVFISTLVYGADLWSAGILLIYDHWSLSTQPKIPFEISKWIYVGCIVISFMLLAWEIRKTRSVMDTRDISLAVTNPLAYKTYSIKRKFHFSTDWDTYGKDWPQRVALLLMSFTCILWILSAIQIFLAVLLYFPILCHIQGNLKEYCCHKIDKRINELLEKQRKKRIREREKYANSISSKKSKKSTKKDYRFEEEIVPTLPTLPVINNNNVSPYVEKNDAQWLYQQPQQQNSFNNYYDSQPMTPLESSYSLQRNPTKYSPYNETYYLNNQRTPSHTYAQPTTTNDYYHSQQQYSNDITSPALINNSNDYYVGNNQAYTNVISKPNTYDETIEPTSAGTLKSSHNNDNNQNDLNSAFWKQGTVTNQEVKMQDDSLFASYKDTKGSYL
ncbi:hypothetical protein INT48_006939 [Thamnidium elegans]|uniref:Uncharacterized protein n=1 Tax=Thamnidium elegans TaxID=101142 RepID=A0A8H7SUS9_9FUNG|nr:hypothetical protein INT48_006939 [Thamnidium elegans]